MQRRKRSMAAHAAAMIVLAGVMGSSVAATNCGKAKKTDIEMLLCSNDKVARADNVMALAFRDAFGRSEDPDALLADQQRWTHDVRDACKDIPCLMRVFEDRASELQTWRPPQ